MKIITLITHLILVLLITSSYSLQASTTPKTYAHVCDISKNIGLNCSSVDNGFLLNKIAPHLTYRPHPSCVRGGRSGSNTNCAEIVNFLFTEHTIFDVKNNQIRKVGIRVSPTGNDSGTEYTFTNLSPSSEEYGFLAEMLDFRNDRIDFEKRLQFTQNDDEIMINTNGETYAQLLSSFGIASESTGSTNKATSSSSIGNCTTMLDYYNNALGSRDSVSCRSRLNSQLAKIAKEDESDIDNFFRRLKVSLKTEYLEVSTDGDGNEQKVTFKFGDKSVLTLEITYNGAEVEPGIKIDEDASKTSDQSTLAQYLNDLTNTSVNQIIFSGREIGTIYGAGFNQCRTFVQTIGYIQKVKVTVTARDGDGRPIAWEVELLFQRDITKNTQVCGS